MRFTYFFKFLSSKRKKPFHIEISFPLLYFDTIDRLSITKNFATLEEQKADIQKRYNRSF